MKTTGRVKKKKSSPILLRTVLNCLFKGMPRTKCGYDTIHSFVCFIKRNVVGTLIDESRRLAMENPKPLLLYKANVVQPIISDKSTEGKEKEKSNNKISRSWWGRVFFYHDPFDTKQHTIFLFKVVLYFFDDPTFLRLVMPQLSLVVKYKLHFSNCWRCWLS